MKGARLTLRPYEDNDKYIECSIWYGVFETSMIFNKKWFQLFTIQWRVFE